MREPTTWEPLREVPARSHVALRTDRPTEGILADLVASLDDRLGSASG